MELSDDDRVIKMATTSAGIIMGYEATLVESK